MWKYRSLIGIVILVAAGLIGFATTASAAPAGAATNLKVTLLGCTNGHATAQLSWTPAGNANQRVDLRSQNNGFASGFASGNVSAATSAAQLTQLTPGKTYYVRVVTLTGAGLASDTLQFAAGCEVTTFSAPRSLQAVSTAPTQARFVWTPGQNNQWFCVDIATNLSDLQSLTGSWRNYCWTDLNTLTANDLRCGTTYVWSVYAWNGGLNAMSAVSTVQTQPCVIGQPTGLNFKQVGKDGIRLDWTAGQNNRWFCVDVAESLDDLKNIRGTWRNFGCWSTATTLSLAEVDCGKVYHFNVYTWNEWANNRSANSTFELLMCEAELPAPIQGLNVEPTVGKPGFYTLTVVGVLPNNCYSFDSHKVSQKNNVVTVSVVNLLERDGGSCSRKATTYEVKIDLGNKFKAGDRYTVNVNSQTIRFTAN